MKIRCIYTIVFFILAGCGPSKHHQIEHDVIQFKGDTQPTVTSRQLLSGDLSNLTGGETLVSAIAKDGSGVLSQPTIATVNVIESVLSNTQSDFDMALERCDPDGDGILDAYCPELFAFMQNGALGNRKIVLFQSWYLVSNSLRVDQNYWSTNSSIDIAEQKDSSVPLYLKMLTINRGNKTFDGDLTIYAQVPYQIKPVRVDRANKVKDNTANKALVAAIPYIQVFALAMDNFVNVISDVAIDTDIRPDGLIKLTAKNITLEPGEGINLEYTATYDIAGITR